MTILNSRRAMLLGLSCSVLAACATNSQRPVMAYLDGKVFYRERILFAPGKTLLRVRLLDITQNDAPPAVLAEQIIEKAGPEFAFSLCYDSASNTPGRKYAIDARLFSDGELRMQAADPVSGLDAKPEITLRMVAQ